MLQEKAEAFLLRGLIHCDLQPTEAKDQNQGLLEETRVAWPSLFPRNAFDLDTPASNSCSTVVLFAFNAYRFPHPK